MRRNFVGDAGGREAGGGSLFQEQGRLFMNQRIRFCACAVAVLIASLFLVPLSTAQENVLPQEYQAQAMGQGTQMGQNFNVTVIINQYSSPEERQVLVQAFEKAGSQGLYNALSKMPARGHIAITGTLGYDVIFARAIPGADGTKIRILTNRPITFGEAWTDNRSMDYNLSAMEIDLSTEKGKSSGVLLPACQFEINKKTHELEIKNYQNPWKLVDVLDRTKK
jgi:hypothetical protein